MNLTHNKSKILKKAWHKYKGHFNKDTFSNCLKWAWNKSKKVIEQSRKLYKRFVRDNKGNLTSFIKKREQKINTHFNYMKVKSKYRKIIKCENIRVNKYNNILL